MFKDGKLKTSISLDEEALEWIEPKIKEKRFATVSHAIGYVFEQLKKQEKA